MLDTETKRKIDNARDILVGKVPDPKSQVEQITIALIYKFMDDMDKESEEWGGEATFFKGEYKKYSWSKIFDPRLGGHEMTILYGEAIERMNRNPNIPQLFRDIFKNAYLPYRDPETLKSFLKEINEFQYDHSERLGDAFEYLLSVMDSQGDAGQFRTPRHIIDFIVKVVDPKKNDMVLDPACGTAGFLISSYKHILNTNAIDRPGDRLTPDEKKRLLKNFAGYDISPDMVRLSLVNLYLHGFSDPKILEYDTLTSEERWNETYDVVLANPPFMTPKGGIRPHKRFSIQAKRSEVLFVDYIAEHLNPNGRAGVIVPEGIIFQSQNAYKNLRKMLIENYLWAVVSLPAGVFQPYSGVKTSILLMDKALAKKTNKIIFVKVESDGFNLGAQRRPVKRNDLPKAWEFLKNAWSALLNEKEVENTDFTHLVDKAKIAESRDWNLSGERYREIYGLTNIQYDFVRLDEIFLEIKNGRNVKQIDEVGKYRVTRIETIATGQIDLKRTKWTNDVVQENDFIQRGDILLSHINSIKHLAKSAIFEEDGKVVHGVNLLRFRPNKNKVIPKYISAIFKSNFFITRAKSFAQRAVNQASIRSSDLKSIKIPLPPLDVQKAIVAEIEGYQKIIDGARQVVDNYKPTIKIDPDWPMVELGEGVEVRGGKRLPKGENFSNRRTNYPYLRVVDFSNFTVKVNDLKYISREIHEKIKRYTISTDEVFVSIAGTIGIAGIIPKELDGANLTENAAKLIIIDKTKLIPKYLVYCIASPIVQDQIKKLTHAVGVPKLALQRIKTLKIPIPAISIQKEIVAQIETEQEIVDANKKLIEIFEQKIKDKISEVWGE